MPEACHASVFVRVVSNACSILYILSIEGLTFVSVNTLYLTQHM